MRVVKEKPTLRENQGKCIPSWMSKHPVFYFILQHKSDDHQYLDDPFVALADFKVILEIVRKRTVREVPRKTPGKSQALIASTALRVCRNRRLGTLIHCCEAWEPVGKCFDHCSFDCIDFPRSEPDFCELREKELQCEEQTYVLSFGHRRKRQRLGEV